MKKLKNPSDVKVILVTRRTRLEALIDQYNTEAQAEFVVNSRGDDFESYRVEHQRYYQSVRAVRAAVQTVARVQPVERSFLANFMFGPDDLVVVVGQDGLVANTLKYLNGQPIIAINPEPDRYDGILLPFQVNDTKHILNDVIKGHFQSRKIAMAKATLNDGQILLAVNDLFIGPRLQTSARYQITLDQKSEEQSSSGIIVSTGLGSTGWLKSIVAGAAGVMGQSREPITMAWDADYLQFAVREPFPSQTTGTELIFGQVHKQNTLTVASHMPAEGVIFSDGMVEDVLNFTSGTIATLSLADTMGTLIT